MQQTRVQPARALDATFNRIQRGALIVAGVGLLVVIIGALFDLGQFMRAYLYAYLFWLGISLGSLAWLLIFHLTGGAWGVAMRRVLEANILVLILMALLFVPLVFGVPLLYPWARPEVRAVDPLLQYKFPYLNVPFFLGRAVGYFVIWIGVALLLTRWSRQQERATDAEDRAAIATRLRQFGGPGVVLYGLTMTFAAFDWTMSLEPHWFSSIYGVMIIAGQVLTAMAFAIVVLAWLTPRSVLGQFMTDQHFNDLGNFLLGATLFWMYIAFCQFLIIWSGNLPEEVVWYLARLEGGWVWVAVVLLLFHFALPFAILLSARLKRNANRLAAVAGALLAADLLHLYWLVEPAFHPGDFALNWLALVTPFAIGGIWLYVFLWWFRRRPLLPPHTEAVQELTFQEVASDAR
jgi:hypothetical protein